MTQVNIILPAFRIQIATKSQELITHMFNDVYSGFRIEEIVWFERQDIEKNIKKANKKEQNIKLQCGIRLKNMQINFRNVLQNFEENIENSQSLQRIKSDIASIMELYSQTAHKLKLMESSLIEKGKRIKQEGEEISLSLKEFSKDENSISLKKQSFRLLQGQISLQKQLQAAVSALTRQNIQLKNALMQIISR